MINASGHWRHSAVSSLLQETLNGSVGAHGPSMLIDGRGEGDGWVTLDALAEVQVDGWFEAIRTTRTEGLADAAGSWVAIALIDGIAIPLMRSLLVHRRAWRLDLVGTRVRIDGATLGIVALSVAEPGVAVLISDDRADDTDAVVVDPQTLLDYVALDLATVFHGLFAAVRRRAPFGLRGMWGMLADDIATLAVSDARAAGVGIERAWTKAHDLIDAIAIYEPLMRNRPSLQPVVWRDGTTDLVVRGTCCVLYKVGGSDRWCTSCPLRDPSDRASRYAARLVAAVDAARDVDAM